MNYFVLKLLHDGLFRAIEDDILAVVSFARREKNKIEKDTVGTHNKPII